MIQNKYNIYYKKKDKGTCNSYTIDLKIGYWMQEAKPVFFIMWKLWLVRQSGAKSEPRECLDTTRQDGESSLAPAVRPAPLPSFPEPPCAPFPEAHWHHPCNQHWWAASCRYSEAVTPSLLPHSSLRHRDTGLRQTASFTLRAPSRSPVLDLSHIPGLCLLKVLQAWTTSPVPLHSLSGYSRFFPVSIVRALTSPRFLSLG